MTQILKRGDIQTDNDGTEWYICGVVNMNGQPKYSRVRVGSVAHSSLIGEDLPEGTDGTDDSSQEKHGL